MVTYYCKWFSSKTTILIGMSMFCLSIFFIGTSPLLSLPDNGYTMFIGACMLGFSACMVTIPLFPEMLHQIEIKMPELKGDELNNVSAGFFNSFLGAGETLGPITASLLTDQIGFRNSEDVLATLILVFCVVYIVVMVDLGSLVRLVETRLPIIKQLTISNEFEQCLKEDSSIQVNAGYDQLHHRTVSK